MVIMIIVSIFLISYAIYLLTAEEKDIKNNTYIPEIVKEYYENIGMWCLILGLTTLILNIYGLFYNKKELENTNNDNDLMYKANNNMSHYKNNVKQSNSRRSPPKLSSKKLRRSPSKSSSRSSFESKPNFGFRFY